MYFEEACGKTAGHPTPPAKSSIAQRVRGAGMAKANSFRKTLPSPIFSDGVALLTLLTVGINRAQARLSMRAAMTRKLRSFLKSSVWLPTSTALGTW